MCQAQLEVVNLETGMWKAYPLGKGPCPPSCLFSNWLQCSQPPRERPVSCSRNLSRVQFQSLGQPSALVLRIHQGKENPCLWVSLLLSQSSSRPIWKSRPACGCLLMAQVTFRLQLGPTASGWPDSPWPQGPCSVPCHMGTFQGSSLRGLQHTDKSLTGMEERAKVHGLYLLLGMGSLGRPWSPSQPLLLHL